MSKTILITGASTGIGYHTAITLSKNSHYNVFGTVRNSIDAETLETDSQGKIKPLLMDVSDDASVSRAFKELEMQTDMLFSVINNAGIVVGGPIEYLPIARLKEQMEVNVFGLIRVTQHAIPLLRKQSETIKDARIINISSIAGLSPLPFVSPYSASKHCVESMSDALRVELAPWHIGVSLIEPGAVKTPIWEKSLNTARTITNEVAADKLKLYQTALDTIAVLSQRSSQRGIEPATVTKAIIHALESKHPKTRYLLGKDAHLRKFSRRLPDRWQDWLIKQKLGF